MAHLYIPLFSLPKYLLPGANTGKFLNSNSITEQPWPPDKGPSWDSGYSVFCFVLLTFSSATSLKHLSSLRRKGLSLRVQDYQKHSEPHTLAGSWLSPPPRLPWQAWQNCILKTLPATHSMVEQWAPSPKELHKVPKLSASHSAREEESLKAASICASAPSLKVWPRGLKWKTG